MAGTNLTSVLHNSDYQQRFVEGRFEDATAYILRRINADLEKTRSFLRTKTRTLALNLIWKLSNYTKFQIFTIVNSIFASTKISVFDTSR